MIRPAKPQDLPGIVSLALESLNTNPYKTLVISEPKVREVAKRCISCPSDFSWVCEVDGRITGVVAATAGEMLFYERKQASVLMFYCNTPGEGVKMLRELMRWYRSRRVLKMLEFTMEPNMDPRIEKLLTRLGLRQALPVLLNIKGEPHE